MCELEAVKCVLNMRKNELFRLVMRERGARVCTWYAG